MGSPMARAQVPARVVTERQRHDERFSDSRSRIMTDALLLEAVSPKTGQGISPDPKKQVGLDICTEAPNSQGRDAMIMTAPADENAVCDSQVRAHEAFASTRYPSTAILTFELAGVSSNAVAAAEARRTVNHLIAGGEAARQRALGALLHGLGENDGVSFVHAITGSTTRAPRYAMQIECRSRMPSEPEAIRRVLMLGRNLGIALAAGFPEFSFKSGEPMALTRV